MRKFFPLPPWPHQLQCTNDIAATLKRVNSVVCCSPTGAGKTLMISAMINAMQAAKKRAVVYNFRQLLVTQMSESFDRYGIHHGVRSAAHKDLQNLDASVQVSSIFTDMKRMKQECWDLHDADYVFVDEAHLGRGGECVSILQHHLSRGAKVIGFTATPLGLSGIYADIVIGGTKKELRACGAHVPARVFAPHQLDIDKVKRVKTGEFDPEVMKEIWSQQVVGSIISDWRRINPDARQTLHFAPGVKESLWVAEEFNKHGVKSAHIDAMECVVDGKVYKGKKARSDVLAAWDAGEITVLSNCDILKEGIDRPSIYCLLLTRPIYSLETYDQVVGRMIRRSDQTPDEVVMVDFAANYARHGSPNADRDWNELFSLTEPEIEASEQKNREEREFEPIVCPECGAVRMKGPKCLGCGTPSTRSVRKVIQADGQIREVTDRMFKKQKPRKLSTKTAEQKRWESVYFMLKNARRDFTFQAAYAIYEKKFGEWPPDGLRYMPKNKEHLKENIRSLEWNQLH